MFSLIHIFAKRALEEGTSRRHCDSARQLCTNRVLFPLDLHFDLMAMMMTYEMSRAPYCDENYMNPTGKEPMNAPAAVRNAIVSAVPNKAVGYAEEHPKERHHPRSADSMTDARTLVDTGNCCISL